MRLMISLPPVLVMDAKAEAVRRGATFSGLVRISLQNELKEVGIWAKRKKKKASSGR